MTLESPSRVRSYEEQRKEGKREQRDEEVSILRRGRRFTAEPRWWRKASGRSSHRARTALWSHTEGGRVGPSASCVAVTHRSWDVRARRSLAVGPGCGGASDFLLFPQQLPVFLLPVLHLDQQRDEAVLHLELETLVRIKLTRADDAEIRW